MKKNIAKKYDKKNKPPKDNSMVVYSFRMPRIYRDHFISYPDFDLPQYLRDKIKELI